VCTALTSAAIKGDLNVLDFLRTNGANVESTTIFGQTPLMSAAKYGHVDIIEALLKQKVEVNKNDLAGYSSLHYAALKIDNVAIIKLLIETGEILDIDILTNQGLSALHLTSVFGDLEIMKFLIKNRANENKLNEIYGAPLHIVAHFGHLNLCKYLISETKADINLPTFSGATPLIFAISARFWNIKIVQILIEHGANINMISDIYGTPMIHAAILGHLDVVKYLIKKKADINVSTTNGLTSLMAAAQQGHFEIVKELLKANPELPVLQQRIDGQSALSLADSNGHTLITEFLCEIVDVQNEDEISTCINTIFTNLYQHESVEDDHDIDEKNEEISAYVNKMFVNLYDSLEEEHVYTI
jgi:ankyrin repeat protein